MRLKRAGCCRVIFPWSETERPADRSVWPHPRAYAARSSSGKPAATERGGHVLGPGLGSLTAEPFSLRCSPC